MTLMMIYSRTKRSSILQVWHNTKFRIYCYLLENCFLICFCLFLFFFVCVCCFNIILINFNTRQSLCKVSKTIRNFLDLEYNSKISLKMHSFSWHFQHCSYYDFRNSHNQQLNVSHLVYRRHNKSEFWILSFKKMEMAHMKISLSRNNK